MLKMSVKFSFVPKEILTKLRDMVSGTAKSEQHKHSDLYHQVECV